MSIIFFSKKWRDLVLWDSCAMQLIVTFSLKVKIKKMYSVIKNFPFTCNMNCSYSVQLTHNPDRKRTLFIEIILFCIFQ